MIGFQILAIEKEDGSFLCDKVSAYFSIELNMLKKEMTDLKKSVEVIYNMFGDSEHEFPLTFEELEKISKAKQCISPEQDGYHELACDGITIIPKTMEDFLSFNQFVKINEERL